MDTQSLLKEKLENNTSLDGKVLKSFEIATGEIKILKLRDGLELIGKILEEDLNNNIYVVSIKAGLLNANESIVAMKLDNKTLYIMACAKEGLIDQKTNEKAVRYIKKIVDGSIYRPRQINAKKIVAIILAAIISVFLARNIIQTCIGITATKKYDDAIENYNSLVDEYNEATTLSYTENVEYLPREISKLQTADKGFFNIFLSMVCGNSTKKIQKDTNTVSSLSDQITDDLTIVKQITNPTSTWVISKLKNINEIEQFGVVTQKADPNGLLNKENGYTSCTYFTDNNVDTTELVDGDIIARGNDAGGTIEVYKDSASALERCKYLSMFDDTILYSGSYAAIGTMVVRTSCLLSEDQQMELTNNIIKTFTALE